MKEFAVAHVLDIVFGAVDVGELPYLRKVHAVVGALPSRTAVDDVEVHVGVVFFVYNLLHLYAVVAVGYGSVAVGNECFGG